MEQYSRRNIICIFGLPEKENEIVEETVINLCKEKLDIDIPPANIDRTHRLGSLQTRRNNKRAIILKLTNYTVLQGGVAMYVKQNLNCKLMESNEVIEQLWVSINIRGTTLIVGTVYRRPPQFSSNIFIEELENTLVEFTPQCDSIAILGNFNINMFIYDDVSAGLLEHLKSFAQERERSKSAAFKLIFLGAFEMSWSTTRICGPNDFFDNKVLLAVWHFDSLADSDCRTPKRFGLQAT
ncbi:hypothetical protein QE152_g9518 [Popillia japonica]|uniref:Endonuclease/exonuclease/phosphatase domain-containing protein n=1 Tax=Popillia japonica TaxID=7064 RepID=A0AAW1LYK5_POPJA